MSTKNKSRRIRAALMIRGLSVPKIARKHNVSDKTLYSVLNGTRSGTRAKGIKAAMAEILA